MRDKGLVFDEMRRQRRALAGPMLEKWVVWVFVVAVLCVGASFASRAVRHGWERSALGGRATKAEHEVDGRAQNYTRVTRGGR